jgi:ribosome biogenesis GTPase / thiamine phosphate phosphatase
MQREKSGPGRVLAQHRGRWLVSFEGEEQPRLLPARGSLRETPPVVGDLVEVDPGGAIAAVRERRRTIVRRAAGETTAAQVLAANVDLALVVESLSEPGERRVERLLGLALGSGVPAALVLTKADLVDDAQEAAARFARGLGVTDAVAVSAVDGTGLGILRAMLEPGTTAALLGRSGAGKSTLVNSLLGEQRQATRPVRAGDGRGRHTTVTRELIPLPGGGLIVDTPGLRSIGLWDGAGAAFDDIDRLAAGCRFRDCRHDCEPGCAVREAVDPTRLAGWHKLESEQALVEKRKDAARRRSSVRPKGFRRRPTA